MGLTYFYLQQNDRAEESYRHALQLDPRMSGSYFGLAKVYQREGKSQQALTAIDSAVQLDSASANYHYLKGQILVRMGRAMEGKTELDAATQSLNASRAHRQQELGQENLPQPELSRIPN